MFSYLNTTIIIKVQSCNKGAKYMVQYIVSVVFTVHYILLYFGLIIAILYFYNDHMYSGH